MKKQALFIFLCVIIIVVGIFFVNYFFNNKKVEYLVGVHHYQLMNDELDDEDYGLFNNYQDYLSFVKEKQLEYELVENDFESSSYIYYVLQVDNCSESIKGVTDVSYDNGNVKITFGVDRKCGVCAPSNEIFFVPVNKDINVNKVKVDYYVESQQTCNANVAYKPILYLYPTHEMHVHVEVEYPQLLLTTYPKYNNGWDMVVKTNGDMYDKDNKYYYALYWDEFNHHYVTFNEGFYVTKDKAIDFLEDKLSIIGLSDKERNEFIMYWLPKLEENEKSLVYFELTEEREKFNRLIITPKPDKMLRVNMHIKKVNKKINIKEQKLVSFDRSGFVVVEWGGTIYH